MTPKFEHFITFILICTWLCYKNLNVFAMTYICCTCMYSSRYILTLFILLYFFLTNVLRIRINQIVLYRQNKVSDYNNKIFENNIEKNWNFPVEFFFVDIQWRSGRGRISRAGDFLAGRSRPRGIRGRETPPVSDADWGMDTWRDHYESLFFYYRFLILPENFIPWFNPFTR